MEPSQRPIDQPHCSGSRRSSPNCDADIPLHRIADVMMQEGVTSRTLAGRLGKTETKVVKESDPTNDMLLSELYQWQEALSVPVVELLTESEHALASPTVLRTRLLRLMRTVRSIQEHSTEDPIQTLAMQLSENLLGMMPELKNVAAWPVVGQPRKSHELGAIANNVLPAQFFNAPPEEA